MITRQAVRNVGPVDPRGHYAALLITLLVILGILQIETQRIAALDRYRRADLGTPVYAKLYAPWQSWQWMEQFDGPLGIIDLVAPGREHRISLKESKWARTAFAQERARAPYELGGSFMLYLLLFITLPSRLETRTLHGKSRWATRADVRRSALSHATRGIVLGEYAALKHVLLHDGEANVLVLGPPGTGKSSGVVIPTLLRTWPESAIVFDPSGELAAKTAWARRATLIFDPRDPNTATFNPLTGVLASDIDEIRTIFAAYICDKDLSDLSETGNYFLFSALELGTALIAKTIERAQMADPTAQIGFADVASYYYDGAFKDDAEFLSSVKTTGIPYVRGTAAKYERMEAKQRSSVIGTLTRYLDIFRSDDVARATSSSSFSVADLRSQSITLYMTVRERDEAALNPLMRMILTRLFDDLTVREPEEHELSIAVILDEFPLLRAPIIAQKLATFRKYRVRTVLLAQSLMQIIENYDNKEPISGLCDIRVYFASFDVPTQESASQACGMMTQWVESVTMNGPMFSGQQKSTSLQPVSRPVLLESELGALKPNECIIVKKGENAILARPVVAHYDRRFGGTPRYLIRFQKFLTKQEPWTKNVQDLQERIVQAYKVLTTRP